MSHRIENVLEIDQDEEFIADDESEWDDERKRKKASPVVIVVPPNIGEIKNVSYSYKEPTYHSGKEDDDVVQDITKGNLESGAFAQKYISRAVVVNQFSKKETDTVFFRKHRGFMGRRTGRGRGA